MFFDTYIIINLEFIPMWTLVFVTNYIFQKPIPYNLAPMIHTALPPSMRSRVGETRLWGIIYLNILIDHQFQYHIFEHIPPFF
jgi:hypothetical protein